VITASFRRLRDNGREYLCGFTLSGHSGYADEGSDIVCAAVSSCAMLTANTISESFGIDARVSSDSENAVLEFDVVGLAGSLPEKGYMRDYILATAHTVLHGLASHLEVLASQYQQNIRVEYTAAQTNGGKNHA